MFGSVALKVRRKMFFMCVKDRLVVKLPAARVKQLIDHRLAVSFDPGHGRASEVLIPYRGENIPQPGTSMRVAH